MARLHRSIRTRFAFWVVFLLASALAGFGITAFQLHKTNQFAQLDEELKYRVAAVSAAKRGPFMRGGREFREAFGDERMDGPPPGGPRRDGPFSGGPQRDGPPSRPPDSPREMSRSDLMLDEPTSELFSDTTTNGFYYVVWARVGRMATLISSNAPATVPQPEQPGRDTGTFFRNRATLREAYHYTERGDCILVGRTIEHELAATRRFALWLCVGGVAVLALGGGGVWWITGRALKPVQSISETARRIADGNLSERINVSQTDNELGELASTLNHTFARLDSAFERQRQFTADASHELRTPLAVMISEAQATLARERSAAEYRETVQACLDSAQQMRRLTESLLQLARLDSGHEMMRREPLDLADVARSSVAQLHPLADERGLKIVCELSSAPANGDTALLERVTSNLISNAIRFSHTGGEIRIITRAAGDAVEIVVTDDGSGIAPEDLPRVFERFYRADAARSRSTGNSGLGLAICKAIVEMHGGSIGVTSETGRGARFTVRLPVCSVA